MRLLSLLALLLYTSLLCSAPASAVQDKWLSPMADKPVQAITCAFMQSPAITDTTESSDDQDQTLPSNSRFNTSGNKQNILSAAARHPLVRAPGISQPRGPPLRHA